MTGGTHACGVLKSKHNTIHSTSNRIRKTRKQVVSAKAITHEAQNEYSNDPRMRKHDYLPY